jgi:DNA repair protein RadC
MATRDGILKEMQSRGATREQMADALTGYRAKHGAFDDERPDPGSQGMAASKAQTSPQEDLTPEQKEISKDVITPADEQREQARGYYNQRYGMDHDDTLLQERLNEEYGPGAGPDKLLSDIKEWSNYPQTKPYSIAEDVLKDTPKQVLPALARGIQQAEGAFGSLIEMGGDYMNRQQRQFKDIFYRSPIGERILEKRRAAFKASGQERVDTIAETPATLGQEVSEFGQDVSAFWEEAANTGWEKRDERIFGGKFTENPSLARVIGGAVESSPTMLMAMGMSVAGAPGAGAVLLAGSEALPQYSEAKRNGKSEKDAFNYALLSGIGTAALEKVGLDAVMGKNPYVKQLIAKMGEKWVAGALVNFVFEGTQEAAQEIWQNAVAMGYNVDDRAIFDGALEAGLSGGVLGGGMSTAVNIMESYAKKEAEAAKVLTKEQMESLDGMGVTTPEGRPVVVVNKKLPDESTVAHDTAVETGSKPIYVLGQPPADVPKGEKPYMKGELVAQRRANTDAQLEAMVDALPEDVRPAALEAFMHPGKRNTDKLNAAIQQQSEQRQAMRPGTAQNRKAQREEAEADSPTKAVQPVSPENAASDNPIPPEDIYGRPPPMTSNVYDMIYGELQPIGSTMDRGQMGTQVLKRQWLDQANNTRHDLWVGPDGSSFVSFNWVTGKVVSMHEGDSKIVSADYEDVYNQSNDLATKNLEGPIVVAPEIDAAKVDFEDEAGDFILPGEEVAGKEVATTQGAEADIDTKLEIADFMEEFELVIRYDGTLENGTRSFTIMDGPKQGKTFGAMKGNSIVEGYEAWQVSEKNVAAKAAAEKQVAAVEAENTTPGIPVEGGPVNVFAGMSQTDLADYWADSMASGVEMSEIFQKEVLSRFDDVIQFRRFHSEVRKRAAARAPEIQKDHKKIKDEIGIDLNDIEIITDPRAARLYKSAIEDFERLLVKLEFKLAPGNDFYRPDAEKYVEAARKNGNELDVDNILNWMGPQKRRALASKRYDQFGPLIANGDTDGVIAMLKKEDIRVNGVFGFGLQNLAGRVRLAQKIQNQQDNRTEIREPMPDYQISKGSTQDSTGSLGFYSGLGREIEGMDWKALPIKDLRNRLRTLPSNSNGRVKLEEIEDLGLEAWLDTLEEQGIKKVNRGDVIAFIKNNGIQLIETRFENLPNNDEFLIYDGNGHILDGNSYPTREAAQFAADQLVASDPSLDNEAWTIGNLNYEDGGDLLQALEQAGIEEQYVDGEPSQFVVIDSDTGQPLSEGFDEEIDAVLWLREQRVELAGQTVQGPKHTMYQMEGPKSNPREFVLSLPPVMGVDQYIVENTYGQKVGGPYSRLEDATNAADQYNDDNYFVGAEAASITTVPGGDNFYEDTHYDVANMIVHFRVNDRTINGKRTLMVEEVQSDWMQKGRKEGFKNPNTDARIAAIDKVLEKAGYSPTGAELSVLLGPHEAALMKFDLGIRVPGPGTLAFEVFTLRDNQRVTVESFEDGDPRRQALYAAGTTVLDAVDKHNEWRAKLREEQNALIKSRGSVPDPGYMKKSETINQLAIRRILTKAAEEGYEAVAWTTGKTQAIRWQDQLRSEAESLEWTAEASEEWVHLNITQYENKAAAHDEIALMWEKKAYQELDRLTTKYGSYEAFRKAQKENDRLIVQLRVKIASARTAADEAALLKVQLAEALKLDDNLNTLDKRREAAHTARMNAKDMILERDRGIDYMDRQAPTLKINWKDTSRGHLTVEYDPETGKLLSSTHQWDKLKGKTLEDLVQKTMAKQILSSPSGKIANEGIVIGAKGFEDIYDVQLPKLFDKNLKKYKGAKSKYVDMVLRMDFGGPRYTVMEADGTIVDDGVPLDVAQNLIEYNDSRRMQASEMKQGLASMKTVPVIFVELNDAAKAGILDQGLALYEGPADYELAPLLPNQVDLATLPSTMASATTVTSLAKLKSFDQYKAAKKKADMQAGIELVAKFGDKIDLKAIAASGADMIVPVDTLEDGSNNAIPYAFAALIQFKTGFPMAGVAVTGKEAGLTDRPFNERMQSKHKYIVEDTVRGKKVLIVDDNFTSGKTVLAVAKAILDAGGTPVMVQTLSASRYGKGLIPTAEDVTLLLETLGVTNEEFRKEFGFEPTALTAVQVKKLASGLNRATDKAGNIRSALTELAEADRESTKADGLPPQVIAHDPGTLSEQFIEERQMSLDFAKQADTTPYEIQGQNYDAKQEQLTKQALALRAFKALRQAETTGNITPAQLKDINAALDRGVPISILIQELYVAPTPFVWEVNATSINSPADIHAAAMLHSSPYFESAKRIALDKNGKPLEFRIMAYGTLNSALVDNGAFWNDLPEGTAYLIAIHNHPSGKATPSLPDKNMTKRMIVTGKAMGVPLLDHVVTNGQDVFSMRDQMMMTFAKGDGVEYARYRDPLAITEYMEKVTLNPKFDWEIGPLQAQGDFTTSGGSTRMAEVLRQANDAAGHIVFGGTSLKVVGAFRFDVTKSTAEIAAELLKTAHGLRNVNTAFLQLPGNNLGHAKNLTQALANALGTIHVTIVDTIYGDALTSMASNYTMPRYQDNWAGDMGFAETGDYKPKQSVMQVQARAEVIKNAYRDQLDMSLLTDLTTAQAKLAMQYAAQVQDYDATLEAIPESQLPESFAKFLIQEGGWSTVARNIADQITGIKELLGMDFEAISGFYFPLRHMADPGLAQTTIADMIEASLGVAASRSGTFEGVILDPAVQVELYLQDASTLIAIGEAISDQRDIVAGLTTEIAAALHPEAGIEITDPEGGPFSISPEAAKAEWELLRDLEKEGAKLGIDKSEIGGSELYGMIAMNTEDGGGAEVANIGELMEGVIPDGPFKDWLLEHGGGWANIVDPSFVVQKMDGMQMGKDVDGRQYGANSNLLGEIFQAARLMRDAQVEERQKQREVLNRYTEKKDYNRVNKLLNDIFLSDPIIRREVMRAPDAVYLVRVIGLRPGDAEIVFFYQQELKRIFAQRAKSQDIRSDMSEVSQERRKKFYELERKIQDGVAGEADVNAYLAYIPKNKLDAAKPGSPKYYAANSIMRNATRWFFERHAINAQDFFGYFDSVASDRAKTDYFHRLNSKIIAWAEYLDSVGQTQNAQWWRIRAEHSIKGNMYQFEDKILDVVANLTKKATGEAVDVKGDSRQSGAGSALDALKGATPGEIKQRILEAVGVLQRARINNWLLGNLGWTIMTQPTSLALTARQAGISRLLKAYHTMIFGEGSVTDSDVAMSKSRRAGLSGIEAVSQFETLSVKQSFRSRARTIMGYLGERNEAQLTYVSYLAGVAAAKDKYGMDEDDAQLHGEFVAATTQSMYDRITRNSALNSAFLRALKPMQTFVFTNFSNALDFMGMVGIKRSWITRLRELVSWRLAVGFFQVLWSIILGDDLLKSLLDPGHNKGSLGSHIPMFGKNVDRWISKLPWKQDKSWQDKRPDERFTKEVKDLATAIMDDDEHKGREALLFSTDYILPWAGVGGGQTFRNLIQMESARRESGRLEKVNGDLYKRIQDPDNPLRWSGGVMFGIKAVDDPQSFKELMDTKKKNKR